MIYKLSNLRRLGLALVAVAAASGAWADTPASSVTTTVVSPGQSYPEVPINSEGWFDVGGFCKVIDVGGLTWANPPASGVPVFIPGPAAQWENYRTMAPNAYHGDLVSTTCCRPQSNIATLCTEAGATLVSVSRQYGKMGEVDTVTASCIDMWGKPYTDQVNVGCEVSGGGPDGPDAQGVWVETTADATSNCTPNANITYGGCSASCGGGNLYETVQNSCGVVTAQGYIGPSCNTQSCCTPNWQTSCGGCDGSGNKSCTTFDANSCPGSGGGSSSTEACVSRCGVVATNHCTIGMCAADPNSCGGDSVCPDDTWTTATFEPFYEITGYNCTSGINNPDGCTGGTFTGCWYQ